MFTETLTLKGPTGCCVLYVVELENSIPMHLARSGARSSYRWLNNRLWLKINEIENESSLYDSFSVHVFCNKYYEMIKNTLISIHPSIHPLLLIKFVGLHVCHLPKYNDACFETA